MVAALADAAAFGREDYLDAAAACARFVDESMRDAEGRLLAGKDGAAKLNAYLEDHALLVEAYCACRPRRPSSSAGLTSPVRPPTR